jgi:hypothetical protein
MEKLSHLVENSFMIAWEYLEATGELGEAEGAACELLDIIHDTDGRAPPHPDCEYRDRRLPAEAVARRGTWTA